VHLCRFFLQAVIIQAHPYTAEEELSVKTSGVLRKNFFEGVSCVHYKLPEKPSKKKPNTLERSKDKKNIYLRQN